MPLPTVRAPTRAAHPQPDPTDTAVARMVAGTEPAPSRRAFLAGLSASAIAAALPVGAQAAPAAEHPDRALFEAEAACRDAVKAFYAARDRSRAARRAYQAALGSCPPELVLSESERGLITHPRIHRTAFRSIRPRWAPVEVGGEWDSFQAWTARALRTAIAGAVPVMGRAGRTPHHVRRWRALLPAAEAYDARCDELEARFRVHDLEAITAATDRARIAAETRFGRLSATSAEGLAVKVRHLDGCNWMGMDQPWIALLQSAAAVAGVELRRPAFDCERWARELQEAGGSIRYDADTDDGGYHFPIRHDQTRERRELLTRLSKEEREHGDEIRFWLSQGGLA